MKCKKGKHDYQIAKDEQGFPVFTSGRRKCSNIYTVMRCTKCKNEYLYKGVKKDGN